MQALPSIGQALLSIRRTRMTLKSLSRCRIDMLAIGMLKGTDLQTIRYHAALLLL